jgi:hypothetical protein
MTAEQRYWRAIREAALIHEANLIQFLSGQSETLPALVDIERQLIVAELARALSEPST